MKASNRHKSRCYNGNDWSHFLQALAEVPANIKNRIRYVDREILPMLLSCQVDDLLRAPRAITAKLNLPTSAQGWFEERIEKVAYSMLDDRDLSPDDHDFISLIYDIGTLQDNLCDETWEGGPSDDSF